MWLRCFFHKHASNADLEEELQAHIAIEAKQLTDRGVPKLPRSPNARHL